MVRTLVPRFLAICLIVSALAAAGALVFHGVVAKAGTKSASTTCSPTMGSIITTTKSISPTSVSASINGPTPIVFHTASAGYSWVPVDAYMATGNNFNGSNVSAGFFSGADGDNGTPWSDFVSVPVSNDKIKEFKLPSDGAGGGFSGNLSSSQGEPLVLQFYEGEGGTDPTVGNVVVSAQYRPFKTCQTG